MPFDNKRSIPLYITNYRYNKPRYVRYQLQLPNIFTFTAYWITSTKSALQVKSMRIIASGVQCLIQFVNLVMTMRLHLYTVWLVSVWYVSSSVAAVNSKFSKKLTNLTYSRFMVEIPLQPIGPDTRKQLMMYGFGFCINVGDLFLGQAVWEKVIGV